MLRLLTILVSGVAGCSRAPAPVDKSVTSLASGTRVDAPTGSQSSPHTTATAPEAAVIGSLECRAKQGDRTYELFLLWDGNLAGGSLRTIAGGQATTKAVQGELYKGLVLVNPAGSTDPAQRIATMQEEGTRILQVGDWKEPWLACEQELQPRSGSPVQ